MNTNRRIGAKRSATNLADGDSSRRRVTIDNEAQQTQTPLGRSKGVRRSFDRAESEASSTSLSPQSRHSSLLHPFAPSPSVASDVLSTATSVIPEALRDLAGHSTLETDMDSDINRILGLDKGEDENNRKCDKNKQDTFQMNPKTLRFTNPKSEREYLDKLATRQLRPFRLGMLVGSFVWLISGVYHYLIEYYFVAYLNAFAFIFSSVCAAMLNKEEFAIRNFVKLHLASYFAFTIVAVAGRYPQYLKGPAVVSFIVNYIFIVVIRSTYLESVLMSVIAVLFLIAFSFVFSDAMHVFCFTISTVYLSVTALYMFQEMEMKNRRIFVMNAKIRERRAIRSKEQKYFEKMLFDIYPEPVARDVLEKGMVTDHYYSSDKVFVMVVQLFKDDEQVKSVINRKTRRSRASEEIHGYGLVLDAVTAIMEKHKLYRVKSTGLCVVGCLNLFGIVDESDSVLFDCAVSILRCLIQESFHVGSKKISCKVSISSGKVFGGIIEGEKQNFDIHGKVVAAAWAGLGLCPVNTIISCNCIIPQTLALSREITHRSDTYLIAVDSPSHQIAFFDWKETKEEDAYVPLTSVEEETRLEKDLITKTYYYFFHFYKFHEIEYEKEYQQYICGISNALMARADYSLYLIMFIITGLLDIYIYYDLGGNVREDMFGYTLLFRFFIIFPLVLGIQLLLYINDSQERIERFGTKVDQMLVMCGFGLMGLFAFSKGFMVYDSHLKEDNDLNELVHFFSEAYDLLGAIASCSYIPYNTNMATALLWYEISAGIFLFWNAMFNLASWIIVCNWIGMFIFSACFFFVLGMISKEYATRKEYLYRKYLVESLEEAEFGRELVLETLQSVVGQQMCSKIMARKRSVVDLDESVSLCIIRLIPDDSANTSIEEYYELLNLVFNVVEEVCLIYKIEVIKLFGENILIWSRSSVGVLDHLQKAIRFSFDVSRIISNLYAQKRSQFNFRIGVCTLDIIAGIVGHRRFTYDIVTDTLVPKLFYLVDDGHLGTIQVDQETSLLMEEISGVDVIAVADADSRGDGFRRYIQPMSDPWKLFASYIVWAHETLEESPVPKVNQENLFRSPVEIITK